MSISTHFIENPVDLDSKEWHISCDVRLTKAAANGAGLAGIKCVQIKGRLPVSFAYS